MPGLGGILGLTLALPFTFGWDPLPRDPDGAWVNLGTARVQVLEPSPVSIYISPGKQTRLIAERYWEKKQSCPSAIVCGIEPVLFAAASLGLPWGVSEYLAQAGSGLAYLLSVLQQTSNSLSDLF